MFVNKYSFCCICLDLEKTSLRLMFAVSRATDSLFLAFSFSVPPQYAVFAVFVTLDPSTLTYCQLVSKKTEF